jgi:hypothetical protein
MTAVALNERIGLLTRIEEITPVMAPIIAFAPDIDGQNNGLIGPAKFDRPGHPFA